MDSQISIEILLICNAIYPPKNHHSYQLKLSILGKQLMELMKVAQMGYNSAVWKVEKTVLSKVGHLVE